MSSLSYKYNFMWRFRYFFNKKIFTYRDRKQCQIHQALIRLHLYVYDTLLRSIEYYLYKTFYALILYSWYSTRSQYSLLRSNYFYIPENLQNRAADNNQRDLQSNNSILTLYKDLHLNYYLPSGIPHCRIHLYMFHTHK